jgi:serine/threonine protein kinase
MLNQQIHNYKIISLLGEGGMANVYLAENQVLGNKVALKILKEEYVQHPNIRKRFLAEARNLAKMNHPNVIKVTDLIDAGDFVAFVMEYIDGQTIEKYIEEKGKLSDSEIESFFDQMIASVEYIHSQGFIHRDIKPSNFMITKNNEIKLLDFGIAKNTNDGAVDYTKTGLMQQMGTPLYMSPEQIKNTSEVTKQTDIYSLGVVLWQMVMGKKPYDTDVLTLPEIQVAILKEPLPLTNTIWDEFIKNFSKKSEHDRIFNTPLKTNKETFKNIVSNNEKTILSKKMFLIILGIFIVASLSIILLINTENNSISKPVSKNANTSENSSSDNLKKSESENREKSKSNEVFKEKEEVNSSKNDDKRNEDSDNDGTPDINDDCPNTFGPAENKGCPYIEIEKPKTIKKNRTVNIYNQFKSSPYGSTSIDKIEITNDYTIIYFTDQLSKANSTWVSIDPGAYIYDKGDNSFKDLIYVSGIELSPSKTYAKKDNEIIKFKLYFPRVSEKCTEIDFIESSSSSWKFYDIKLNY